LAGALRSTKALNRKPAIRTRHHEETFDGVGKAAVLASVVRQKADRGIHRHLGQRERNADAGEKQFGGVKARVQRHQHTRARHDGERRHHGATVTQQRKKRRDQKRGDRNRKILEQFEQACLRLVDAKGVNRLQDDRADAIEQNREDHVDQRQRSDHAKSIHGDRHLRGGPAYLPLPFWGEDRGEGPILR
jgi:hypothetical protein